MNTRAASIGMALPTVLPFLIAIMLLGIAAANFTIHNERSGRNERDYNIAFQAAEAALKDAENDVSSGARKDLIEDLYPFPSGCVATAPQQSGLCSVPIPPGDNYPAWKFIDAGLGTNTVRYGAFTSARCLPLQTNAPDEGCVGVTRSAQGVARQPRYLIEKIMSPGLKQKGAPVEFLYRITAVGFGPRETTRVILQSLYRPS